MQVMKEQVVAFRISAATYLEMGIVLDQRSSTLEWNRIDEFIKSLGIRIEPVTESQAKIAREAYRIYGRGSGHRANLNFGDCFSYALAEDLGEPILFKGDDFVHTDLVSAIS